MIKYLIITFFLVFSVLVSCSQTTIYASATGSGWNASDATQTFVDALKSANSGDTVIIDSVGDGMWRIAGRHPQWFDGTNASKDLVSNNVTIIFEKGVTLLGIGNYGTSLDMLMRVENVSGWNIIGYGATFKMDESTLAAGEYANSIAFYDCSNMTVKGLKIDGNGADGFLISTRTQTGYSSNILIEDCEVLNSRRQGISIISCDSITVKNCSFKLTGNAPPNSGLDLEPNYATQRLSNIVFDNVLLEENYFTGILFAFSKINNTSTPFSAIFNDTYIVNNWQIPDPSLTTYKKAGLVIGIGGGSTTALQGSVVFNRLLIKDEKLDGIFFQNHHDSYSSTFNNLVLDNIGTLNNGTNEYPININRYSYGTASPAIGNIYIDGLYVKHPRSEPWMRIGGSSSDGHQIEDFSITNARVKTPFTGVGINNVNNSTMGAGASFVYTQSATVPVTNVSISSTNNNVYRGLTTEDFVLTRSSSDISYPLHVEYSISGTAINANDYNMLHGYVIIPAGSSSTTITIEPRYQIEIDKTLILNLATTSDYTITGNSSITMNILQTPISPNIDTTKVCNNNLTILIDGIEEPQWTTHEDTLSKIIYGSVNNTNDISVNYKLMWDNTNLYVIAHITDDTLINDSPNEWNDDGIEVFIDGNNEKNTSYDANDRQYILRWNDNAIYEHGFNSGTNPTGVVFAQTNTTTGYTMELSVAWSSIGVTPTNGKNLGFEIQVNDDDDGGVSLEARRSWFSASSPAPNPSIMGTVKLDNVICQNSTSIKNIIEGDLLIYPNPTSGELTIASGSVINKIEVYNSLGVLVLSKDKLNKQTQKLDVSNLPKGIYSIRISGSNRTIKKQIIKQ